MTGWMEPATRVNKFTQDIIEYCESDPHLFLEMLRERENFLTKTPEKFYQTLDDEATADLRFDDYFIYSYTSKSYQRKPIAVFLSKMLHKYNQKDKEILQGFKDNIFSGFIISTVWPGSYFIAKDLSSGKEYKVRENQATFQLQKNDYFIGRILPYESDYVLSGINLFLPDVPSYTAKRAWKDLSTEISNHIDPLMIEREILQRSGSVEVNNEGYNSQESIETIEKKLKNFLKKHLGKKAPSVKSLRKKINRIKNPVPLIKELTKKMHISSQEEFIEFQQLFNDFWNLTPRDEFQGKSPEEMAKGSMGPLEKELVEDFKNYVEKNMDITKFSNKDEIEKAIKELPGKWLNEPQEELDGKTPFQVMKEEREKLDSPRKDFPFSININPIDLDNKDLYNLNDIQKEDSPVARDVEIFVSYFQEKRIKVTQKNRWIPFKHLKLIEKNFINPVKDSFTFLGKEEERGEETRKKYIHFIHLLSRAERLIYNDKKGYVQVNHKHFKKFTKNNYGENILKLMLDWIEKVNWVKLQATEYTTFNAQDYQENIISIWGYFYHLKPNKKKTLTALTKDLYWDSSREQEELNKIDRDFSPTVQNILLKYLKWFGVIDTIEEIIFPDLGIRSIKQFWVTTKGKKLINRVLIDFWEKGKIKTNKHN